MGGLFLTSPSGEYALPKSLEPVPTKSLNRAKLKGSPFRQGQKGGIRIKATGAPQQREKKTYEPILTNTEDTP